MQGPQRQKLNRDGDFPLAIRELSRYPNIQAPGSKVAWMRQLSREGEETRAKEKNQV